MMSKIIVAAAALAASATTSALLSGHGRHGMHEGDDVLVELMQVRKATAPFHSLHKALADGYAQFQGCVAEPGEGAMGIHFVHGERVGDTILDPLRPEALMYEPGPNGQLKLVGVEYIVFKEAWDLEYGTPPTMFGQPFHLVASPNRYGIPAFYALHAWVWRHNPEGNFSDWNPKVECP